MRKEIYTIEMNLDKDFADSCSYHIDSFENTSSRNIRACCEKIKTNRWALVGLAYSHEEAREKCEQLRNELCEMHNRKPYGMEEILLKRRKKEK